MVDGVGKSDSKRRMRVGIIVAALFAALLIAGSMLLQPRPMVGEGKVSQEQLDREYRDAKQKLAAVQSALTAPPVRVVIPPRKVDAGPCACVPGDPLCSCL